jgi:uncharacterized protein YndB with AHSA1/START domain
MTTAPDLSARYDEAVIEADPTVPIIHIRRDFTGTPQQLFRAHTDPELFARWIGPDGMNTEILAWDATDNGRWRYAGSDRDGNTQIFRGSFHTVSPATIVQTFTWEGMPDAVALETLTFDDLGDGRTRLHAQSLCDSFRDRDMWISNSGMDVGVQQGYAALDRMLADRTL